MPRDLKEPDGWRFSSLRWTLLSCRVRFAWVVTGVQDLELKLEGRGTYHPAARERALDSLRGVRIQGLLSTAIVAL